MRGRSPESISYDETSESGGHVVRLRMSTAWATAKFQKPLGALLATMRDLVCSMIVRTARSATPLRGLTSAGTSFWSMRFPARKSLKSLDTNSPALSLRREPIVRTTRPSPCAPRAMLLNDATNLRI